MKSLSWILGLIEIRRVSLVDSDKTNENSISSNYSNQQVMSDATNFSSNEFVQNKKNGIELFEQLGLNSMQARIYLSLVSSGTLSVDQISKVTKIARQDIYKVMPTLTLNGLVDKFIERPVKYRAIKIKEGVARLVALRKTKTILLNKKANEFIQKFSIFMSETIKIDNKYTFIIISEKNRLTNKIKKTIKKTKRSIDMLCPGKDLTKLLLNFSDNFVEATNRNVKIRIVTCKKENTKTLYDKTKLLKDKYTLEIKSSDKPLRVRGAIYDKENFFIAVNPTTEALESPALFSHNPTIVELFQSYFDGMWDTSF